MNGIVRCVAMPLFYHTAGIVVVQLARGFRLRAHGVQLPMVKQIAARCSTPVPLTQCSGRRTALLSGNLRGFEKDVRLRAKRTGQSIDHV